MNCGAGQSGELGCFQYLRYVWEMRSEEVLGYIAPQTPINEEYVTLVVIQKWLDAGHDVSDIALIWNQGNNGPCIRGTNDKGVEYDSCEYQAQVLAYYHR